MSVDAVTQAELEQSKDKLVRTVVALAAAAKTTDDRTHLVEQGAQELKEQLRVLRNQATMADQVRPTGTDAEAYARYTVDADNVKGRIRPDGDSIRYGAYDGESRPGIEYVANKQGNGRAIRMLSEWDEIGLREPGLLDDPAPCTAWQAKLQHLVELRSLAKVFGARPTSSGGIRLGATPKLDRAVSAHIQRGPDYVKQVFADNSGEGAEFIPDITLPELMRLLEVPRNLIAAFPQQTIPSGGSTINPFLTYGVQPFIVGVPASGDLDPADIQRSVPSLTTISTAPKTWGITLPASRDATEDSIIEWGGFAQMMLAEADRDGMEDAAINADTNGGDTGLANWNPRSRWGTLGNTNDHRKSFVGLRHESIDRSSHSDISSAQTAAGIMAKLANLSAAHMVDDIIYVTSPEFMVAKLMQDPNLLTVDKYGNLATLLTGEVARIGGRPLILSEFVDVQYNASGVYDDSTKTKTGVLIVNRNRWAVANRRGPRVETEVVPKQHMTFITLTRRWTLRKTGSATEKSVAWLYNCSPS